MKYILASDAAEAWKLALKFVLENGKDFVDYDGRVCREVLNMGIEIKNPKESISKPIGILSNLEIGAYPLIDEVIETLFRKDNPGIYDYCYGPRIFNYHGVDQIHNYVIPLLKANPNSRRAVISLWDPTEDSKVERRNVVGWMVSDFKIRENKLHLTFYARSIDLFIGWPVNVYQQYILMEKVAREVNVGIGSLTTMISSVHIFLEYGDKINKVLRMR